MEQPSGTTGSGGGETSKEPPEGAPSTRDESMGKSSGRAEKPSTSQREEEDIIILSPTGDEPIMTASTILQQPGYEGAVGGGIDALRQAYPTTESDSDPSMLQTAPSISAAAASSISSLFRYSDSEQHAQPRAEPSFPEMLPQDPM